jgi:hypothetical protein
MVESIRRKLSVTILMLVAENGVSNGQDPGIIHV